MRLTELLRFEHIAIQCHDRPDADALGSGFGLWSFFQRAGKQVDFYYSGPEAISRPNLLEMVRALGIPVRHEPSPAFVDGLLIMVDCQYGAGNAVTTEAREVAVIDHRPQETPLPRLNDLRPFLGSCSTLVGLLLEDAGFVAPEALSAALHYGLYCDTNGFDELRHPCDLDLRDRAAGNERVLKKLKRSGLSLHDLSQAAASLQTVSYHEEGRLALIDVPPCESSVPGLLSDLAMLADAVDVAVAFCEDRHEIRYAVRSAAREAKASELAGWMAGDGLGSGGGTAEKAGGRILRARYDALCRGTPLAKFFRSRVSACLRACEVIDGAAPDRIPPDPAAFRLWRKRYFPLGFIPCGELFPEKNSIHIRMLEGDLHIPVNKRTCLMIGLDGEIYPLDRDKFDRRYARLGRPLGAHPAYEPAVLGMDEREYYEPMIIVDKSSGSKVSLLRKAWACTDKSGAGVLARQLERGVKVFNRRDEDSYAKGEPGDWLVMPEDDPREPRVIRQALFPRLYQRD